MASLSKIVKSVNNTRMDISIDKLCKIKNYISIEEKIKFAQEYKELLHKHINDYVGYETFIAIVLFDLKVVQTYTDIDLELSFKEYDELQGNGLIDKIIEFIGYDYKILSNIVIGNGEK